MRAEARKGVYMKIAKRILLVVVLFVLLVAGASSVVITRENEYSLVRQFGKIDHVVSEAGISFSARETR